MYILRGRQNVGRRPLGRIPDLVNVFWGVSLTRVGLMKGVQLGDLPPHSADGGADIDEFGKDTGSAGLSVWLEHRGLKPGDSVQQQLYLGRAIAARVFGQEPAAESGIAQCFLKRSVVLSQPVLGPRNVWLQ